MEKYNAVPDQLSFKLVAAKRKKMDCLTTSRLSGPCSVCRKFDDTVHLVGVALYCARHCPVHEVGPRLAIAGEAERSVVQALDEELTAA